MKTISRVLDAMDIANDALADDRERIVRNLSLLGGVLLGAISILHLVAERWSLMALNLAVASMLVSNVWNPPLLPPSAWRMCNMTPTHVRPARR